MLVECFFAVVELFSLDSFIFRKKYEWYPFFLLYLLMWWKYYLPNSITIIAEAYEI